MFGKLASDALGLSDIGKIIAPADYDKADVDDYVFHEDNERIFFLIKSKSDEYCFTNQAFIHLDGASAISKKRALKRYAYKDFRISSVWLETAGTIDLDVEIKFNMGGEDFSIDVNKKQLEQLKDLYKSLYRIGAIQEENMTYLSYAAGAVEAATESMSRGVTGGELKEQFAAVNQYVFDWKAEKYQTYQRKDYTEVFELYINN